jgi:hypothetical protein
VEARSCIITAVVVVSLAATAARAPAAARAGAGSDPAIVVECEVISAAGLPEVSSLERVYALDEIGASGLLLDPAAKAAWEAILGPLREESWLAELNGPSPTNRFVNVAGRAFLLASPCKSHDCYDNNVVLLYCATDGAMYGELYRSGQVTLLGAPSPELARELHRLWREEFRQGQP